MRTYPMLATLALASPLAAQSLPPYAAVNPVVTSRSGLYSQPYLDPRAGWGIGLILDYANSAELNDPPGSRSFLLDGEYLRLDAWVHRDVGKDLFVLGNLGFYGAYTGFLDGFLNWYHNVIGIQVPARSTQRPENRQAYRLTLEDGTSVDYGRSQGFLGDLRVGAGHRHTKHWQTVAVLTLPTSTGPEGYGRGVVSASAVTTLRTPLSNRWTYEGTMGLGVTPTHGALEDVERSVFGSVSSGLRWRFWGQQVMFGNMFYGTSQYHDTGLASLDRKELTIDFGWLLKARKGPEFQVGMTQDLSPSGPALDLSFRLGARW